MSSLKRNAGQFIPMAAMVAFTIVMLMVAAVNIYKVSRAKLKVQNIADAVALNLASQQAQSYNVIASRNEWMNHMVAGAETPTTGTQVRNPNNPCAGVNPMYMMGISCVDNDVYKLPKSEVMKRHIFNSKAGAINYAGLVKTMNDAQKLYVQAFNNLLGATGRTSDANGPRNMRALLENDIPDLKDDPTLHLYTWNSAEAESAIKSQAENLAKNPDEIPTNGEGASLTANMTPLSFTVKDVYETHWKDRCANIPLLGKKCAQMTDLESGSLASKYYTTRQTISADDRIGYMVPCDSSRARDVGCIGPGRMPEIKVPGQSGAPEKSRTGVGVKVVKKLDMKFLGSYAVTAEAKAFIVDGSGGIGRRNENDIREIPRFQPTYWVKLAN